MAEKLDPSLRRSSKAKAEKGVKPVAKTKREPLKSASAASEKPSFTNDATPVLRTSRISRLIRDAGWASVFVGVAVAVSVAIPMVVLILLHMIFWRRIFMVIPSMFKIPTSTRIIMLVIINILLILLPNLHIHYYLMQLIENLFFYYK